MTAPLRSQGTRDRILDVARRLFAEHGYERTTIRGVAASAGVNPSMVIRYYGSKEELFATAAEIDLRMPDLSAAPAARRGEALVAHFLDRWEGPEAGDALPALLRAAGTHEAARRRVVEMVAQQAAPAIGAAVPDSERDVRVGLVITQLAGLAVSRYVLRHPLVVALDRETIVRHIGAAVQLHMNA